MNILWNRIASHWQAVLTAAGILYAAFVTSMPEHPPQKFEDYWATARFRPIWFNRQKML